MKISLGIIVTTIVLYLWGFLFWGLSEMPYSSWKQTADDAATQVLMRKAFPESGTYFLPGFDHEPDQRSQLYEQGPVGFVHINLEGRPEMDPSIMVGGFVLNLVIVLVMAGFFKLAGATEFRDFARLSLGAAAIAVIAIHGGDMVWWQISPGWKVWQLLYDLSALILAGHLLGIFMKAEKATE
jgi:hypothetical protein|tara:strand:+ start:956 stop:1504 length:549 start_codon:yes stop_codon:yes gene_type:complete